MPVVHVEMWERRTTEQKRRLALALTDVIVRVIACERSTVRVLFRDYAREDWAVGGVLQADRDSSNEVDPV